jgi:hypothetical protein
MYDMTRTLFSSSAHRFRGPPADSGTESSRGLCASTRPGICELQLESQLESHAIMQGRFEIDMGRMVFRTRKCPRHRRLIERPQWAPMTCGAATAAATGTSSVPDVIGSEIWVRGSRRYSAPRLHPSLLHQHSSRLLTLRWLREIRGYSALRGMPPPSISTRIFVWLEKAARRRRGRGWSAEHIRGPVQRGLVSPPPDRARISATAPTYQVTPTPPVHIPPCPIPTATEQTPGFPTMA